MLHKLKELVFGLNEYEKTKIDLRFIMIQNLISELKINELTDFEILEAVIYKIKDQLRVRSSNLNKIISDPAKSLRKKDVNKILEQLDKLKYDFLRQAFTAISEVKKREIIENIETPPPEIKQNPLEQEPQTDIENITIIENENYTATLENGKTPHILISFNEEIDYTTIKQIMNKFFETYLAQGTNVLIENNKALIIPRIQNDNLLQLPTIETDINEAYQKITEKINEEELEIKQKTEEKQEMAETPKTTQEDTPNDKYPEYYNKFQDIKSSKNEDLSLDSLLEGKNDKNLRPRPNPKSDTDPVTFEKSDPIEVEKEVKKEIREEDKIEVEKKVEPTPENNFNINKKTIIYQDEKILVYLKNNSKVLGEIIIRPTSTQTIKTMNESDLSYMMIFSKIFSSVLFELTNAHGTNMIYNYEKNYMQIIPRYQKDELGINWTPKEESDSFLDDLKNKLLAKMQNALQAEKQEKQPKKEETKKDKRKISQDTANEILKAIKRIP